MADGTKTGDQKSKSALRAEREDRLARALRDNLAKRKAQFRARQHDDTGKKTAP